MKKQLVLALTLLATFAGRPAFARDEIPPALEAAIAESHEALRRILNGDPSGYMALFADRDDITLGNPFGPYGKGRTAVVKALTNASTKYHDGTVVSVDRVAAYGDDRYVCLVEVEHDRAKLGNSAEFADFAARVTSVYEQDGRRWRLVHRHADPITTARPAESMVGAAPAPGGAGPDTNPLWRAPKVRNYLPDMSWPEVQDLLTRTDMVVIPVGALEQHGSQGPIGTDFYNGLETAQLIAQRTDVLVAPILMPGNSPYHMGFPGTVTLSAETIERVYFEAVQSLIQHGFRRFLLLNAHGGNAATTRFIVDRINQETPGVAVELGEAAEPFQDDAHLSSVTRAENSALERIRGFDRHSGVEETSKSLYLIPSLVNMTAVRSIDALTLPPHLQAMLPKVVAGDKTANLVFLAEALKAKGTGKQTSAREMTPTGNWSVADLSQASAARGKARTDAFVEAAVQFIDTWKALRSTKSN